MSQGKVIRFAVIALPLGLFVLSAISMVVHHSKPDIPVYDENYSKRIQAANLNRKEVNIEDLKRHIQVLKNDIGERNYARPDALHRAEYYIQSTLKGSALGYQMTKHLIPVGDQEYFNISAELTGEKRYKEIVIIGAHYDSTAENDNSTGVATLLTLARAMAGQPQSRTVRFVFFANGTAPESDKESRGSWIYARKQSGLEKQKVIAMLNIDSIGHYSDTQNWPAQSPETLPNTGDFLALCADQPSRVWLGNLRNTLTREKVKFFELPSDIPQITDSDQRAFWNYQFPAILITDTGSYRAAEQSNINYEKLQQICRALKLNIEILANPK